MDRDGHEVTILDLDAYSFRRLSPDFHGTALVGNGLDDARAVLGAAGIAVEPDLDKALALVRRALGGDATGGRA